MRGKEKPVSGGQTSDGQQMQLELGARAPLKIQYTPQPGSIASVLLVGEENAMTTKEICRITCLPFRMVTKRIMNERRSGAPILSSPESGYWLAENADEVIACSEALHKRARAIHATAAALKRIVR